MSAIGWAGERQTGAAQTTVTALPGDLDRPHAHRLRAAAAIRNVGTVIDLHCHVLSGLDDGPVGLQESLALVSAARACGADRLVATPHVSSRYHNDSATIARAVADLNHHLAAGADGVVALDVLPGAEVAFARIPELHPEELARLGLGGGGWLLLEPPATPVAPGIAEMVDDLHSRGHRVVVAHPERCPVFHRDPQLLKSLVADGALTSITAGSLVGRFGGVVRRYALGLFEANLVHNVTSDFHSVTRRPPGTADELQQAGLGGLADWLTHDVPEAILDGREIPKRPASVSTPVNAPARGRWRKWRA